MHRTVAETRADVLTNVLRNDTIQLKPGDIKFEAHESNDFLKPPDVRNPKVVTDGYAGRIAVLPYQ
jgi:hypothetical protein